MDKKKYASSFGGHLLITPVMDEEEIFHNPLNGTDEALHHYYLVISIMLLYCSEHTSISLIFYINTWSFLLGEICISLMAISDMVPHIHSWA